MCVFCTPGFVTRISAYLKKNSNPTLAEVREACKGNFCRCGTYPRVFEATLAAAKKPQAQRQSGNKFMPQQVQPAPSPKPKKKIQIPRVVNGVEQMVENEDDEDLGPVVGPDAQHNV